MAILSVPVKERTSNLFQSIHAWFAHQLDDEKPKGTIAALDGVRAVACIMVIFYHSTTYWLALEKIPFTPVLHLFGSQGITLFFVLSGFLLFLPYVQSLLFEKRWPSARVFYMRRILRIVPGYYFSLFVIILLIQPSYSSPHNWPGLALFLTFLMPKKLAFSMNAVYWTLAVEFQYYLLLPLIALGILALTRLAPRPWRVWTIVAALCAMAAWGMATRYWGGTLFSRPDFHAFLASHLPLKILAFLTYGTSPMDSGKYFEDFAVGMLLAVCYTVVNNTTRGERYRRILQHLSPWLWLLGLVLLVCAASRNCVNASWCSGSIPVTTFAAYPGWGIEFAFALGFGLCVLAILFNGSGLLQRFFAWTPLRWVGLLSFSLYIWQFYFIQFLDAGFTASLHFSRPVVLCIYIVAQWTVMLFGAFVLYRLIERPGMHLSERLRKKMMAHEEQKTSVRAIPISAQEETFAHEQTEPRQSVLS